MLNRILPSVFCGVIIALAPAYGAPTIVPAPKEMKAAGSGIPVVPGSVAIVVGGQASPIELTAAELLRDNVRKRFGQEWEIVRGPERAPDEPVVVLLGRRASNPFVEQFCRQREIRLDAESPGRDGYVIDVSTQDGRTTVLVGGSDERGVLYAQDTLFQLLTREGERLMLHPASIRDWPTVPWRGRPQTQVAHHLQPGIMDCYVASRINFIDLRNGTYAFEPDYQLTDKDREAITTVIRESRRRGIVVYATVNCGVPRAQYDNVLARFREFIELGVDGLWPSFDDRGPGDDPEEIVRRVIALAKERNITLPIATTPPKGSYQTIRMPFNEKVMKVPGMEQALWFWTCLPSAEAAEEARAIGLACRPSWWHNWPRPASGFAHIEGNPLAGRAVMEVPPMAAGWHEPPDSLIAPGGAYLEAVMPWGGNSWEQYTIVPVIGWWGWDPEGHDFAAVRSRIHGLVYGPDTAALFAEFDDTLVRAKSLFVFPGRHAAEAKPKCPARLASLEDRPAAVELLARLEVLVGEIEKSAGPGSMLPDGRLDGLLKATRVEVETGVAGARLPYPEYWWDAHQRSLLDAIYRDDVSTADRLASGVRERLLEELKAVERGMGHLTITKAYADTWTRRANLDAAGWREVLASRREQLVKRVGDYGYYETLISNLLKEARNIPYGRGRGGAERQWRVLASALPGPEEHFRGEWLGGPIRQDGLDLTAFALHRDGATQPGDFSELRVDLPLSGPRDRLGLLMFMNRYTKDSLGLEHVRGRWAGFSTVQLLWEDRIVWEGDVGMPREGHEWDIVRLPPVPDDLGALPLRLRVIDHRESGGMRALVLVGPIRLLELPH